MTLENLTPIEIKKIVFERSAKLFFFCFMSESKALKLAKIVVSRLEKRDLLVQWDATTEAIWLQTLHGVYLTNDKKITSLGMVPMLGHFEIPKSLDLGAWREFKRSSHGEEFYTTCLYYIGGFSIDSISSVQNISVGAVKYRLSRGTKKLGSILLKEYLN